MATRVDGAELLEEALAQGLGSSDDDYQLSDGSTEDEEGDVGSGSDSDLESMSEGDEGEDDSGEWESVSGDEGGEEGEEGSSGDDEDEEGESSEEEEEEEVPRGKGGVKGKGKQVVTPKKKLEANPER